MYTQYDKYCKKCGSKLYPADIVYLNVVGVCSACVTWDKTPDKRYAKIWDEHRNKLKAKH